MTDSMIERVARYLCRVSSIDHESPDRDDPDIDRHADKMWNTRLDDARGLLALMREPDEAMETAGVLPAMSRDPAATWRAMIDEAGKPS